MEKKLKYQPHFEVARKSWFGIEYLTSKGGWNCATGMTAVKPKQFRSYRNAAVAAKKHRATLMVYWIYEGDREYNRQTLYGKVLLPDIILDT